LLAVSDPDNEQSGNFLTIEQIADMIAPPSTDIEQVQRLLMEAGAIKAVVTRSRDFIQVVMPVEAIERLFAVRMFEWKHQITLRVLVRADSHYTMPSSLVGLVDVIGMLSDFPGMLDPIRITRTSLSLFLSLSLSLALCITLFHDTDEERLGVLITSGSFAIASHQASESLQHTRGFNDCATSQEHCAQYQRQGCSNVLGHARLWISTSIAIEPVLASGGRVLRWLVDHEHFDTLQRSPTSGGIVHYTCVQQRHWRAGVGEGHASQCRQCVSVRFVGAGRSAVQRPTARKRKQVQCAQRRRTVWLLHDPNADCVHRRLGVAERQLPNQARHFAIRLATVLVDALQHSSSVCQQIQLEFASM
jgi:hypothetical protein